MNSVKNIKGNNATNEWINKLSFSQLPKIVNVAFIKDEIAFILNDERVVYIPVKWSKKLLFGKELFL